MERQANTCMIYTYIHIEELVFNKIFYYKTKFYEDMVNIRSLFLLLTYCMSVLPISHKLVQVM